MAYPFVYPLGIKTPSWRQILRNDGHSISDTQKQTIWDICLDIQLKKNGSWFLDIFGIEQNADLYKEYEDFGQEVLYNQGVPDWRNIEENLKRILNELDRRESERMRGIFGGLTNTQAFTDVNAIQDEEEPKRSEWLPGLFSDTTRAVTEKDLSKLAQAIGKGWELLGLALGLDRVQLDYISSDNRDSTAMKIYTMLATWLNENQSEATVGKLYQAMNDCGKVRLNLKKIKQVFSDIGTLTY